MSTPTTADAPAHTYGCKLTMQVTLLPVDAAATAAALRSETAREAIAAIAAVLGGEPASIAVDAGHPQADEPAEPTRVTVTLALRYRTEALSEEAAAGAGYAAAFGLSDAARGLAAAAGARLADTSITAVTAER